MVLFYFLSFAKYNWKTKNKLGAIGAIVMGLAFLILTCVLIFSGNYEI
jgi:multisubunit Na+/H+ antiporter MnhB subunit